MAQGMKTIRAGKCEAAMAQTPGAELGLPWRTLGSSDALQGLRIRVLEWGLRVDPQRPEGSMNSNSGAFRATYFNLDGIWLGP